MWFGGLFGPLTTSTALTCLPVWPHLHTGFERVWQVSCVQGLRLHAKRVCERGQDSARSASELLTVRWHSMHASVLIDQ